MCQPVRSTFDVQLFLHTWASPVHGFAVEFVTFLICFYFVSFYFVSVVRRSQHACLQSLAPSVAIRTLVHTCLSLTVVCPQRGHSVLDRLFHQATQGWRSDLVRRKHITRFLCIQGACSESSRTDVCRAVAAMAERRCCGRQWRNYFTLSLTASRVDCHIFRHSCTSIP